MPGIEDRIADLERRLKQAKALKQQQVAREKAAERKRQRSDDTRRKILVGAVILAKVEHGDYLSDLIAAEITALEALARAVPETSSVHDAALVCANQSCANSASPSNEPGTS